MGTGGSAGASLRRKPAAPDARASRTLESVSNVVSTTTARGTSPRVRSAARPSRTGIRRSRAVRGASRLSLARSPSSVGRVMTNHSCGARPGEAFDDPTTRGRCVQCSRGAIAWTWRPVSGFLLFAAAGPIALMRAALAG